MTSRVAPRVLVSVLLAMSVAWVVGCDDDEDDDCMNCCECWNDGAITPPFRPVAPGDCSTCTEQCQALADRDHMGQEFDNVKEIGCPDE